MRARANLVMRLRHLRPRSPGMKKKCGAREEGERRRENIAAGHISVR
jgi:hypothetical protein